MDNCLEIVALRKRFGDLPVLDGWDLQVRRGERLVLLGPSGCGKTTFLRLVAGLEPPTSGAIHSHADQVGFVFQDPRLIPWKTVDDNLRFVSPDRDPGPILGSLGLEGFADYLPGRLSGGMRQRVNLARALLTQPDLLILDEAFRSLDLQIKARIIDTLAALWREQGFTLLTVTHDPREALLLGDRIVVLSDRPSRIRQVIPVELGASRTIWSPELAPAEARLFEALCAPP